MPTPTIFDPRSWGVKKPDNTGLNQAKKGSPDFSDMINTCNQNISKERIERDEYNKKIDEIDRDTEYMFCENPLNKFNTTQIKVLNGKKYYYYDGFSEDVSDDGDELYDMSKSVWGINGDGGDAIFFNYISNTGGERYSVYGYYKDPKKMKTMISESNKLLKYGDDIRKGTSSPSERPFNGSKRKGRKR